MANLGGEIGGKIGNSQNPFFTDAGGSGITPDQQFWANYDYGQNLLEALSNYQGEGQGGGPIMSTMATQGAGGAGIGKGLMQAELSDVNQKAAFGANTVANTIQGQNQQSALTQLAQLNKIGGGTAASDTAAGISNAVSGTTT